MFGDYPTCHQRTFIHLLVEADIETHNQTLDNAQGTLLIWAKG